MSYRSVILTLTNVFYVGLLLDLKLSSETYSTARRKLSKSNIDFSSFLEVYASHSGLLDLPSGQAESLPWVPTHSGRWVPVRIVLIEFSTKLVTLAFF